MNKPLIYKKWPPKYEDRIQLYSMGTPNGLKASIALEEMGLPYEAHIIDIMEGDQFSEEFKSVNPNSKIPALLDPDGPGGKPITIMESGAILFYLGEKSGKLLPKDPQQKSECLQWLFFQVGSIGPMFGQFGHFYRYAGDKCDHPYPVERYSNEVKRLMAVLDERLEGREYILNYGYSVADIAIFPWVNGVDVFYNAGGLLGFNNYKNVMNWLKRCNEREGTKKGTEALKM